MTNLLAAALAHGSDWAILPTAGYAALAHLEATDALQHEIEWQARMASMAGPSVVSNDKPYIIQNGAAVIRIDGVMTKRPTSMGMGTSSLKTQHDVRLAARDEDASSILLVVSSNGGSVDGVDELWQEIAAANLKKPVTAFIDDNAYSAGYWAACAAGRIVINRNGGTGSLGAMMVLEESAEAAKADGIRVKVYSTGNLKGQGTPGTEHSEEFDAMVQRRVNERGAFFSAAIADGRGMDPEQVAKVFTGEIFSAQDALQFGLVDEIGSLDDTIRSLSVTEDAEDDTEDALAQPLDAVAPADAQASAAHPVTDRPATPTISAREGGETAGPQRPGKTEPTPKAAEKKTMSKELLVRALKRVGLNAMATALVASDDNDMEGYASTIAANVDAEVKQRLEDNPLMQACGLNNIKSATDIQSLLGFKAVHDRILGETRELATAACIAAKGTERGPTIAKQLETQGYDTVKANLEAWNAEADATFGNGPGTPAKRQTAPSGALAADVDDAQAKRPWDRLTDSQRAAGTAQGRTTPEAQDAFASNLLEVN